MSATLEQLRKAHTRMLGRVDAANIEQRRALRAGDHERIMVSRRAALRRLDAAMRILDAMGGAR